MIAEDKYNALIVRHLDKELSIEELKDLFEWIEKDEQHFLYYLELKDIWYTGELLYSGEDVAEKALIRFREKYHLNETLRVRSAKMIRISTQVAATILMAFLLSLSWHWLSTDRGSASNPEKGSVQILIPKGQKGQLTLNDGTRIWLNSNSILRYPADFGRDARKIVLDGEAYLEVAKDPAHPFILETSSVTLKVLGTRFNVKCYSKENTVETTLIEGSLEILPANTGVRRMKKVTLKPNEKAIYLKPNNQISIAELDIPDKKENKPSRRIQKSSMSITQIESIISWKDNYLIFRDESFEQITNKMDSWYGVEIRIEDEKLKNYRFTGKFIYNETIEQVMEVISRTTPLQYTLDKNILVIRSK
jgi:ferric-dicitrate binding protein FerR (iron transport regulator)